MIDATAWSGLEVVEPVGAGNRNRVWRGRRNGIDVAIRRSTRPAVSLDWELDLLGRLRSTGLRVPATVLADDGRRSVDGVVVQTWLDGRAPASSADWGLVAEALGLLHTITDGYRQRPGCVTVRQLRRARRSVDADIDRIPPAVAERLLAVFERFGDVPTAVVHGDPGPGNIRIDAAGSVGLLDWDESRVDLTWHDLSDLGLQVLDDEQHRRAEALSHAWEAANGWIVEPAYARRRLELLERPDQD